MSVFLKAIAMVRPSDDSIQAPSEIRPPINMTKAEFDEHVDTAKAALVSLEPDGLSNPQLITAYTIPVEVKTEGGRSTTWTGRFIVSDDSDSPPPPPPLTPDAPLTN